MVTLEKLMEATGGRLLARGADRFTGISIDSRSIAEGELFVAIRGDRFDGHDFAAKALEKGAGAVVAERAAAAFSALEGRTVVAVEDPLKALQDLARFMRRSFGGPVVAVVGSNGKTTTKELTAAVLGTRWKVHKTEGNLNNEIGMPLCITRMPDDAEVLVLELGTNHPGEIAALCAIAEPDTAVITNIGFEHLEGFGTIEAVRDAELEVLPTLRSAAVNGDDRFLLEGVSARFKGALITYGVDNKNSGVLAHSIAPGDEGTRFVLRTGTTEVEVTSRLAGRFNVYNSLGAAAVGHILGLDAALIRRGLESFQGVPMRFEVRRVRGATVLYDVYNANPSSMEASLRELASRKTAAGGRARAIAVLGDMLELGAASGESHEAIGRMLGDLSVDLLLGVGPLMKRALGAFSGIAFGFSSAESAGAALRELAVPGDIVLIKGSRGLRMEGAFSAFAAEDRTENNAVVHEGNH